MHLLFIVLVLFIQHSVATSSLIRNQNSKAKTSYKAEEEKDILIVGGTIANDTELNFLARIEAKVKLNNKEYKTHCGGSIISKSTVLSAAHCFYFDRKWIHKEEITIYVGHHKLTQMTPHKVEWYNVHPDFDYTKGSKNDIAVIKVQEDLELSDKIKTINYATEPDLTPDVNGTIAGWGSTSYDSNGPTHDLYRADIRVYNTSAMLLPFCGFMDNDVQFCAGKSDAKDSCHGDSGGPFVWNDKVYGIVSNGALNLVCNGYGIYTKVSMYADWIEENSYAYTNANRQDAHAFLILGTVLLCLYSLQF